ncbi:chaperonin 10-like protein [Dactylonectria estremocensis]|uniref:Chaperonin 10-like protein n=1 Tax=Dactylonectria estremocensis TaxID=1079267 RepID=A0A9P9E9I7_9HYPO|nr:chaperonin 10-like protein [Dactylonectria estremocensis]
MATMRAFLTDGNGSGHVQNVTIPTLGAGEILVKTHYAALNPGDWKLVEGDVATGPAPKDLIVGCDFAGVVEDANNSHWSRGQRVAGFVHGTNEAFPKVGAFAEYITIEASLVYAIPDNVTFQQACTIPLAFATATQALYRRIVLPEPSLSRRKQNLDLLVYGASTSVGQYAIQLAKLSGLRVFAVAGSKNHDMLKDLGADLTFDYRDEGWAAQVEGVAGEDLRYALDCIAEGGSPEKITEILSHTDGHHLVALSPVDRDAISKIHPSLKAESTIAFSVFGKPLGWGVFDNEDGPILLDDKKLWEDMLQWLPLVLEKGGLKPNQVKEVGTLDDVQEAFTLSKQGKVSAEKIVLKVIR